MGLTGPGDSTVSVRQPAGRLDAVVKTAWRGNAGGADDNPGVLLIDARGPARSCICKHSEDVHSGTCTCTCKMK